MTAMHATCTRNTQWCSVPRERHAERSDCSASHLSYYSSPLKTKQPDEHSKGVSELHTEEHGKVPLFLCITVSTDISIASKAALGLALSWPLPSHRGTFLFPFYSPIDARTPSPLFLLQPSSVQLPASSREIHAMVPHDDGDTSAPRTAP